MTEEQLWIVVRKWRDFQHYPNRDPIWIKNYTRLLHDPAYLGLTHAQRGVLHGLWMLYAASGREVHGDTAELSRALNGRVTSAQLEALNHAGFIEFTASKPLALARSREEEKKNTPKPPQRGPRKITQKDARRYTGCRWVRGLAAGTHIRDPLGMDKPPSDWPYPPPTIADITHAIAAANP